LHTAFKSTFSFFFFNFSVYFLAKNVLLRSRNTAKYARKSTQNTVNTTSLKKEKKKRKTAFWYIKHFPATVSYRSWNTTSIC